MSHSLIWKRLPPANKFIPLFPMVFSSHVAPAEGFPLSGFGSPPRIPLLSMPLKSGAIHFPFPRTYSVSSWKKDSPGFMSLWLKPFLPLIIHPGMVVLDTVPACHSHTQSAPWLHIYKGSGSGYAPRLDTHVGLAFSRRVALFRDWVRTKGNVSPHRSNNLSLQYDLASFLVMWLPWLS